jgi:fluoride exporter
MSLVLIALGGAFGAVARYGVGRALAEQSRTFPWATLIVNLTGAFLLGFLSVYLVDRALVPVAWRNAINGGIIGAYTTFSTLSVEGVRLIEVGRLPAAALYLGSSLVFGLGLAWLGQRLATTI